MVSVILPFYNAEDTLDEAIQSIVSQSYSDWELILVDNKSSDRSSAIAQAWSKKDPRIKVLFEQCEGVAFAMNAGVLAASGVYIARMDADDISYTERLEKQVSFLEANPEVGVLATRVEFISELEYHDGYQYYVDWQNELTTHEDILLKRFVDAPIVQPTTMIRKGVFEKYGEYNTGPVPEDFELWLRWMHAGVRFAKLPEVLFTWRDSMERLSRSHSNFSTEAFDRTKSQWLADFLKREHPGRAIVVLGTSKLCRERAMLLHQQGIEVAAFSDISGKTVPGYAFIDPKDLGPDMDAFVVSMISQRGAGDQIAAFLNKQGLSEGKDFILAA